jgi:hypothetical protein
MGQQQLASMRAFTPWQTTHTILVSWQPSTQKGTQQKMPVSRNNAKHQM